MTELNSSITWLDFSEDDRHKMTEVISFFKLRETRDELGLGSIRNALADLLFPGTTTLQTRARYFLFIPWIYTHFERRRVPSARVATRLGDRTRAPCVPVGRAKVIPYPTNY